MTKNILLVLILATTLSGWAQEIKRPKEMWVFRSVLDKRARIITVALHDDLYVAYDGNNCGVFKIWKEGVQLDGAVYTSKHGPQPVSLGKPYSLGIVDEQIWNIYKDGKEVPIKVQFKGYTWKANKVTFHYQLTFDAQKVTVHETPEYSLKPKERKTGLERIFTVQDLPAGYTVGIRVNTENMVNATDFVTDGIYKMEAKTEKFDLATPLWNSRGLLTLKSNAPTRLVTYFSPEVVK